MASLELVSRVLQFYKYKEFLKSLSLLSENQVEVVQITVQTIWVSTVNLMERIVYSMMFFALGLEKQFANYVNSKKNIFYLFQSHFFYWLIAALGITTPSKCRFTKRGQEYRGTISQTAAGDACQMWSGSATSEWRKFPEFHYQHNYCRNPKNVKDEPYCQRQSDGENIKCDIPMCGEFFSIHSLFHNSLIDNRGKWLGRQHAGFSMG